MNAGLTGPMLKMLYNNQEVRPLFPQMKNEQQIKEK